MKVELVSASPFDFQFSLEYAARSPRELVDRVDGRNYFRLFKSKGELFLIKTTQQGSVDCPRLQLEFLTGDPDSQQTADIIEQVSKILNLILDLTPFYRAVEKERVMKRITKNFYDFKPVLAPTVFEALVWAILSQQVNLNFAYQLKESFVRKYGEQIKYAGQVYYSFPDPERIASLDYRELVSLKLNSRKAEYLVELAKKIVFGKLNLEGLFTGDPERLISKLTELKGIGRWSAEYALNKGYGYLDTIPAGDLGLKNAVGRYYGLRRRADEDEVRAIAEAWRGFRGLACFYLWKQLEQDLQQEKIKTEKVFVSVLDCPLGKIYLASTAQGVVKISVGEQAEDSFNHWLSQNFVSAKIVEAQEENKEIETQLQQYFAGERKEFALNLALIGTPFQKRVWKQLLTIPYGSTVSYQDLARQLGSSNLCRAVGSANSKNPLAIIIPCHRVIGSNGRLVGYAGGLHFKQLLLDLEKKPEK